MKIKVRIDDSETRAVWEAAQQAKIEVAGWPAWKRGESMQERRIEDVLDDLPFDDAEVLAQYLTGVDSKASTLKTERDAQIERAMKAEASAAKAEAEVRRLTDLVTLLEQSMMLTQVKLGGIAMLLQGK